MISRTRRHEFVLISVFCLRSTTSATANCTTSAIIVNLRRRGLEIYLPSSVGLLCSSNTSVQTTALCFCNELLLETLALNSEEDFSDVSLPADRGILLHIVKVDSYPEQSDRSITCQGRHTIDTAHSHPNS